MVAIIHSHTKAPDEPFTCNDDEETKGDLYIYEAIACFEYLGYRNVRHSTHYWLRQTTGVFFAK